MDEILLEVIGTQRIDLQKDTIELKTVGTLENTDESYIIRYTEQQESLPSPIRVKIKISKDESLVEMTRTGDYSSHLIIEKSKRNLCPYGTQYGDILMGIAGRSIEADVQVGKGAFTFCYDIDLNGTLASKNEVKIIYRNNQE